MSVSGVKLKPACRVFLAELAKSDFFFKENGDFFVVTPTCAMCDKFFGVVEIKEVRRSGNVIRFIITDQTASINAYTDKARYRHIKLYTSGKAAIFAFLGKVYAHSKEKNAVILLEKAEAANEIERDIWAINTAKRTMERVEKLFQSLKIEKGERKGWDEKRYKALQHYSTDNNKVEEIKNIAIEVVKKIGQRYSKTIKDAIFEVLREEKRGIEKRKLKEMLKERGMREKWIDEVIDEVIEEGTCYEPAVGMLKIIK